MNEVWASAKRIFLSPNEREPRLAPWLKYFLPLVLFALTRLATAEVFNLRAVHDVDCDGYVATANYLQAHGQLPTSHDQRYRQFPGLSMLMVVVNVVIGNMTASGYAVVMLSAMAAIVLVQYLFDDLRLTVLFVCFYPWWITTTSEILSEGPTTLCLLVGYWALRDAKPWSFPYLFGLMVAGYGLVIRQTALVFILPMVALYTFTSGNRNWRWVTGATAATLFPLIAYLAWNQLTIGELMPQAPLQREYMQELNSKTDDPKRYSQPTFVLPGSALWAGLSDPMQPATKKIMILFAVGCVVLALARLLFLAKFSAELTTGWTAAAFAAGLACYLAFHLCVGGISGFRALDRYLSQVTAVTDWALFHRMNVRWPWIALICLFFVFYAFFTDTGAHRLGFIK